MAGKKEKTIIVYTADRGGGEGRGYSNMKLVYMCRTGFKRGVLREQPLTENGGLSERPLTGKTGDFGDKNLDPIYTGLVTTVQVLYLLEICCLG